MKVDIVNQNDFEIVIKVNGLIDTLSSKELSSFVLDVNKNNPKAKIIIDFDDVEFITSACIDFLKEFSINNNLELINTSREVYTILTLTNMQDIVKDKQNTLSIETEGCKMIGKGFTSEVYKLDDETIAKVYYDLPSLATLLSERIIAKKAFVKGVPTEISFGICECHGKPGLVYELVNAETLLSILSKDFTKVDELIENYVNIVKEVHKYDSEGIPELPNSKQVLRKDIEVLSNHYSIDEIAKLKKQLDRIPDSTKLLHGDPHPANIMVKDDNSMSYIDLSDMRVGDEIIDLVYLNRTLHQFAKMPGNKYALNLSQTNHLWNLFFNEYYKDLNEEEKQSKEQLIELMSLISITARFFVRPTPSSIIDIFYNELKDKISKLD